MSSMLAWIPFLQPAPNVSTYWWALVFPLSIGVSMAWRAVRQKDLHGYWPSVARMSAQIVVGMLSLFIGLAIIIRVIMPLMPVD
jgi:hypothetical protein